MSGTVAFLKLLDKFTISSGLNISKRMPTVNTLTKLVQVKLNTLNNINFESPNPS